MSHGNINNNGGSTYKVVLVVMFKGVWGSKCRLLALVRVIRV